MTASRNDTVHSDAPHTSGATPLYFPVSLAKLAVMSVATLGFYQTYWFYKNWRLVKDREEPEAGRTSKVLFSIARTCLPLFFCYALFTRIQDSADEHELRISLPAGFLTSGWIAASWLAGTSPLYWLAFFSVLFLLPVQSAVNAINHAAAPAHDANRRFTAWNIAIILVAAGLLAYAGYDALFADNIQDVD